MVIRVSFNVTIHDMLAAAIILLNGKHKVTKVTLMYALRELYHGHAGLHYGIDNEPGLTTHSIETNVDEALELLKKYYDFKNKKIRKEFINLIDSSEVL